MRYVLQTLLALAIQFGLGLVIALAVAGTMASTRLTLDDSTLLAPLGFAVFVALFFGFYHAFRLIPTRHWMAVVVVSLLWLIPASAPVAYVAWATLDTGVSDHLVRLATFYAGAVAGVFALVWLARAAARQTAEDDARLQEQGPDAVRLRFAN